MVPASLSAAARNRAVLSFKSIVFTPARALRMPASSLSNPAFDPFLCANLAYTCSVDVAYVVCFVLTAVIYHVPYGDPYHLARYAHKTLVIQPMMLLDGCYSVR